MKPIIFKLGDLVDLRISNSKITKRDYRPNGQYNVIRSSIKPSGKYDTFNEVAHQITISKDGTCGLIMWHEQPFYLAAGAFVIKPKDLTIINPKYLYHYLKRAQIAINKMQIDYGPIKHLYRRDLSKLPVVVPNLSTQNQVVKVLDRLEQLAHQLRVKLNLRNQQFNYYLHALLNFDRFYQHPLINQSEPIKTIKLGQLADIKSGAIIKNLSRFKKQALLDYGPYDIISGALKPIGKWNRFNSLGKTITITKDGNCGHVAWQAQPFWATEHCLTLTNQAPSLIDSKFLYYYLKAHEDQVKQLKVPSAPPFLRIDDLKQVPIPLLNLDEQIKIVTMLEQLETTINNQQNHISTLVTNVTNHYNRYLEQLIPTI